MLYIINSYNSHDQLEERNTCVCKNIILVVFQQFILIFIYKNHVYYIFQWNTYI